MHAEGVHPVMIGQDWVSNRDMTRCAFPESQLAPVSKTASHVLFDPLPLFVFVVKRRHTWHLDLSFSIASPYSLERITIEILLVRGTRSRYGSVGFLAVRPKFERGTVGRGGGSGGGGCSDGYHRVLYSLW